MHIPDVHYGSVLTTHCRELLDMLDDPVIVLDSQHRVTYANRRAEMRAEGLRRRSIIGRLYSHDLLFGHHPRMESAEGTIDDHTLPGLGSEQPSYGHRVTVERQGAGRLRLRVDCIPVHSDLGGVAGTGVIFHDETEDEARRTEGEWLRRELLDSRKSVERELQTTQVLLETADTLSSWTNLGDIAQGLAEILVRATSHARARVDKYDPEFRALVSLASAGADPDAPLGSRWRVEDFSEAVSRGAATVLDVAARRGRGDEGASRARDGERALLVPLLHRDELVGLIVLDDPGTPSDFSEREVRLVEAIAAQAAVAMENARLYEVEHRIAETLQETLVVVPTHVPGVTFSRAYRSATSESGRVGGDFVDVFHVRGSLVALTLGDVSGKGIDAAVITSLVRTTLRVHAVDGLPPAEVLSKTNMVVRRFTDVDSFVTLWFGLLNTKTGLLRYVSAGHPPAFVVGRNGTITELESRDPVLGAFDESSYFECRSVLRRGERVVLYSDGMTEARSPHGEFLGDEGLMELVTRHSDVATEQLCDAVMSDVVAFSEGVLRDDAAVLAVEPTKLIEGEVSDRQLAAFTCDEA